MTQIETLVRDAYAVYARYVLGLRALDPLGRRADMRERGKVLHTIMEKFVQATDPWPGPDYARQQLVAVAETTLDAAGLPADLRRTWRGRIDRFADWLIDTETARRANAFPLGQEKKGTFELDVDGEPFTLNATVDRIDRLSDGTGAIYDYKSGAPPTDKQIKTGFNQQLQLGATILEQGGFPELDPMPAGPGAYIGLTGGREGGKETAVPDLAETLPGYREQLANLLGAYLAGAPWLSRGRPERIAFSSDYDHLARKAEWASEDER